MHFQPSLCSHLLGATLLQFQQDLHSLLLGGRGAHSCASNQTFILFWGPHSCTSSRVFILFFRGVHSCTSSLVFILFFCGVHPCTSSQALTLFSLDALLNFQLCLYSLLLGATLSHFQPSFHSHLQGGYTLALPGRFSFSFSGGKLLFFQVSLVCCILKSL